MVREAAIAKKNKKEDTLQETSKGPTCFFGLQGKQVRQNSIGQYLCVALR